MFKYYILNWDKKEYMECEVENAKRYSQISSFFALWLKHKWGNVTLSTARFVVPDDFTKVKLFKTNVL